MKKAIEDIQVGDSISIDEVWRLVRRIEGDYYDDSLPGQEGKKGRDFYFLWGDGNESHLPAFPGMYFLVNDLNGE